MTYKTKGVNKMADCDCPRLQFGTEISDRGTEFNWYYCSDCGFDQVS